jgi:nucleoside-diphosphate-sugar epimerase
VASALSTHQITVLSDGTPWRPLINVADMARAIEWAVGREAHEGGDFLVVNTGSDAWNCQVHELAAGVARIVSGTQVSINREAPPDRRSYRVDFSLFASLAPRHQPLADLDGTIRGLQRGLERMGFNNSDFRNSSLIRLQVLADLRTGGLLGPSLEWSHRPVTKALGVAAGAVETVRV